MHVECLAQSLVPSKHTANDAGRLRVMGAFWSVVLLFSPEEVGRRQGKCCKTGADEVSRCAMRGSSLLSL